jgi:hypothetical protein
VGQTVKQVIQFTVLLGELSGEFFILILLIVLLLHQFSDNLIFLSGNLGDQSLLIIVLLFQLLLCQLLVSLFGLPLLLLQLFLLLFEESVGILKDLDLDKQPLVLRVEFFNVLSVLLLLLYELLKLGFTHEYIVSSLLLCNYVVKLLLHFFKVCSY